MNHASLFSGIGGFDLAASWMGWKNIFQVEKDEWCREVLAKHFPDTIRYSDIKEFNGDKYNGAIDIISAGFPCQPFSQAGKQRGKEDDRYLWPQIIRVIREIKPTFVLGENVPGIISMALDTVLFDLESEGYATQTYIIPACAVNAVHRRDRVWIIAYSESNGKIRRSKGHESSSRSQGIRQQDEIQLSSEPSGLSSEFSSDSNIDKHRADRRTQSEEEGISGIDRETIVQPREPSGTDSNASNTDARGNRRHERESTEEGSTSRSDSEYVSDPTGEGSQRSSRANDYRQDGFAWESRPRKDRLRFPVSEPTIRRGDDGVSYRLDDGSLITAKQRKNSLHGLGNAVVPQVVYEIFRIIERFERLNK